VRLAIPDVPRAAQTVDMWLITAPVFHPLWSQYHMACVRLDDDVPGFPPPVRQFDGATHEFLIVALNPEFGPFDEASMAEYGRSGRLPLLTPINVAHQFTASDDEMREVCSLAARAVVNGYLNPETADAPDRIREDWLASIVKTLAHIRGEPHDSGLGSHV
jgi:hypothetical protein